MFAKGNPFYVFKIFKHAKQTVLLNYDLSCNPMVLVSFSNHYKTMIVTQRRSFGILNWFRDRRLTCEMLMYGLTLDPTKAFIDFFGK